MGRVNRDANIKDYTSIIVTRVQNGYRVTPNSECFREEVCWVFKNTSDLRNFLEDNSWNTIENTYE